MIKKIIAISDIHIRNLRRLDETTDVIQKFIDECKNIVSKYGKDEVRIVIVGDVFHNKIENSNESCVICGYMLRELNKICKTIVISGNHDLLINNISRLDSLTPIFSLSNFDNCIYLDKELNYSSGCLIDDNIVWCLFSNFSGFNRPENIEELKQKYPDKTFIGLYHGDINGSKTDSGYVTENGLDAEYFEELDFAILGHIHKRQCIKKNGIQLVYCGSLIQQDFGENITSHGYILWDVETQTYEEHDIDNKDYGFYQFSISNIDDIKDNKEELINY